MICRKCHRLVAIFSARINRRALQNPRTPGESEKKGERKGLGVSDSPGVRGDLDIWQISKIQTRRRGENFAISKASLILGFCHYKSSQLCRIFHGFV